VRTSAPPTISLNNFGLSRLAPYRASVLCCVGPKRKPRFPLGTEAYSCNDSARLPQLERQPSIELYDAGAARAQ
jgi:hypothetical protein